MTLAFFIGALPIIVAGLSVAYNLKLIARSFDEVANNTTPAILFLGDIRTDFLDASNNVLAYAISGDIQKKADYENNMRTFQDQEQRLAVLINSDTLISPQEKPSLLARINSTHADFVQAAQTLFSLSHEERDGNAGEQAVNVFTEKTDAFLPNISTFVDIKRQEISNAKDTVEQGINWTLEVIFFFTIFCFSMSVWANGWIFHSVSRPLTVFRNKARAIINGFTEAKVDIRSQDEFGELARAFNEMTEKSYASQVKLEKKIEKARAMLEAERIKTEAAVISCEHKIEEKTIQCENRIEKKTEQLAKSKLSSEKSTDKQAI